MNFINDRELARRFRDGKVASRERLYYFIAHLSLYTISSSVVSCDVVSVSLVNKWDYAILIASLLFLILGTYINFRENNKGDGKEFIERSICLSFPIAIRLFIFVIISFILLSVLLQDMIDPFLMSGSSPYHLIFAIIIMVYYYYKMNRDMKVASEGSG